ncbi:A-kinase anchor protein 8-like isoform X4 [Ambystoma mexicanum]|uniref:A-kinase anchor protein 8-like isoform X4 n=1 Tax=Ambystoma mexicanum TaxID=8296 RepID=UPI0037E7ACDB
MANYSGYGGYEQDNGASAGNYGYESYESYDSRSSLTDRDLYRSGYDYSEAQDTDNAYEGRYDSPYGNRRDQIQTRARSNFGQRGQNWGRDGRKNRPMASFPGRLSGQWNEPQQPMGGWGSGASGSPRPPSLFSQKAYPEINMFQGMRGFPGNRRFGGGGFKTRPRKSVKVWDGDKTQPQQTQQKKKMKNQGAAAKKRKQTNTTGEPESKVAKNEEGGDATAEEKPEDGAEVATDAEGKVEAGNDKGSLTMQEEISEVKRKFQAGKKIQDRQKKRQRDRMVERIQYVCSLCKFRTYYDDEMKNHLESKFHSDHFNFVGTKLPKQTAEFLQEYVSNKHKKTEERRKSVEDLNAAIQQIYRDQDLTQDLGMDHFIKKVEAAHCTACDLFIPMQFGLLQKHLKSIEHNQNRKAMMEQSKKSSLVVAKSILNNKMISKKLERYLKGENPFTEDPKEREVKEETEEGAKKTADETGAEAAEESKCEEGMEGAGEDETEKESNNEQSTAEEEKLLEAGEEEDPEEEAEDEGGEEAEPME